MKTSTYIKTFFSEKQIPFTPFEIKDKHQTTHFLNTEVVIEFILSAPQHEQEQIASILRKIDFKNGSVLHFLKYLAHGLVLNFNKDPELNQLSLSK